MEKTTILAVGLAMASVSVSGCGSDGTVNECTPEGACVCTEGMERATACVCEGGSSCAVDGDNIEFTCDGNASCDLTCGLDCLVTCPGTTTCTVEVGDGGVIDCPGTATCDVTCLGDCVVNVAGAATATIDCVNEAGGAVCTLND